jgi:putative tricarboxylic transport membrane protein
MPIALGDFGVFVSRPLTVVLLSLAVLAVVVPYLPRLLSRGRAPAKAALGEDD